MIQWKTVAKRFLIALVLAGAAMGYAKGIESDINDQRDESRTQNMMAQQDLVMGEQVIYDYLNPGGRNVIIQNESGVAYTNVINEVRKDFSFEQAVSKTDGVTTITYKKVTVTTRY